MPASQRRHIGVPFVPEAELFPLLLGVVAYGMRVAFQATQMALTHGFGSSGGASSDGNAQNSVGPCPVDAGRDQTARNRTRRSIDSTLHDRVPIIVHCHLRWDFVWQRPQHIFSRLAANHPVLFIEEPIWQETEPTLEVTVPQSNVFRVVPILPPEFNGSVDAQCETMLPLLQDALDAHPLLAG